jgi:uncharacterized protein
MTGTETEKPHRAREYTVRVLNGMAQGLFASLIIGLILKQIGTYTGIALLADFGQAAQYLMGPAIGVGVAAAVHSSPLAVCAALVCGAVGAGTVVFQPGAAAALAIGEPVGALLAALAGAEFSKLIAGRTKVDILLVPALTIAVGSAVGVWIGPAVAALMSAVGSFINYLTTLYPLPMGILVSVTMGMILTLPISSAAIAISLGLSGLAAGAATVGCSCQMIGFAVSSFRENRFGGLVSQGLGTSMIQIPNIVRNWRIWVPPTAAAAVLGPLSTLVFRMENNRIGAGMGTSGLVGQVATVEVMGSEALLPILLLHFILPAAVSLAVSELMRRKGWIKAGDMALHTAERQVS